MTDDATATVGQISMAVAQQNWLHLDSLLDSLILPLSRGTVRGLLTALVDDPLADQYLFGIVHGAETATDHDYIACLLDVLPTLVQSAPRWARILVIRVMNSSASHIELIRVAPHAAHNQQGALMHTLQLVEEWRPNQFGEVCSQVRAAMAAGA